MKVVIKKVAVLGSGIMGSRIACHFANAGMEVLLLDIAPTSLTANESKSGRTIESREVRNRIVDQALREALAANPSPVYTETVRNRITTGNFVDNLKDIQACDWVLEAVVENLAIKQSVFEQVEKYRRPGTIVSSNTSGIPITQLAAGRSEDFRQHFCGTHFFNPPRYLRLLELIPTSETLPEVMSFLETFGGKILGKTTVRCKDTPAFIANRVGIFAMMSALHLSVEMGLSVEEIDKFTGPVLGRPKSATFRTSDVVGLDTLVRVAQGISDNCPDDEARSLFTLPGYVTEMVRLNWLGDKTGQGFYKKVKQNGKTEILALDLQTLAYRPSQRITSPTMEAAKGIDDLEQRLRLFAKGTDRAAEFVRAVFYRLFAYVSNRVPEISDELYRIDDAMRAGFGWEMGPFETWDALGLDVTLAQMAAAGLAPAPWVTRMNEHGATSFYRLKDGNRSFYDPESASYREIPGQEHKQTLSLLRQTSTLWKNNGTTITDLGDGIINLEFHTKMNTIGGEVLQGIHKAIDLAERDFRGIVIANDGANFSAGANVGMIFMMALEQDWEELNIAVRAFQNTSMRIRYSSVPVVVAPFNMTLGGGCEFSMHADHVQAHTETYMGLVEFGVGLLPGGGGTKEMAIRISDEFREGQIDQQVLRSRLMTVASAKVSTSAANARELGYLQDGSYAITMDRDRLLADAKASALRLAEAGYMPKVPRRDIRVLGKQGLGIVYAGANSMFAGRYISEHDKKISEKLGMVLCGGELSQPALVSEQYLLDLEREAFLSLCGEKKTLERIQSILKGGKVLRN